MCCLMHYHSKGYQKYLQVWPIDVLLSTTCIYCMYEYLNHGFMHVVIDICNLKTSEYVSTLKKKLPTIFFCRGKCFVTTCNIPHIKSIHNRNKMLEMAYGQQYNQKNTTIILE
jgi:hypothetical protein